MKSYYKSVVITFMLAQASEYTWMTRKLCPNGTQTILKDLIFKKNQSNWIELSNIESNFIGNAIPLFMQIASAKSWNARSI